MRRGSSRGTGGWRCRARRRIARPAAPTVPAECVECADVNLNPDARRLAVQIPMGFTEMLSPAPELALAWRMATREIFTSYFDAATRQWISFSTARRRGRVPARREADIMRRRMTSQRRSALGSTDIACARRRPQSSARARSTSRIRSTRIGGRASRTASLRSNGPPNAIAGRPVPQRCADLAASGSARAASTLAQIRTHASRRAPAEYRSPAAAGSPHTRSIRRSRPPASAAASSAVDQEQQHRAPRLCKRRHNPFAPSCRTS